MSSLPATPLTQITPNVATTPREVGARMARLREQFNLTPQEVSERLHIRPRYITAIEEGQLEKLPGPVYARGYIQTYAEFLGLDPEPMIAEWFAAAPSAPSSPGLAARTPLAHPPRHALPMLEAQPWRAYLLIGLALLVVSILLAQLNTNDVTEDAPVDITVTPVPEDILASARTGVMPTPGNIDCLMHDQLLSCIYAQRPVQRLMAFEAPHWLNAGDAFSLVPLIAPSVADEAAATDETSNDEPDAAGSPDA